MAETGIGNVPRDPTMDNRTARALRRLSGRKDKLMDDSMDTDDRKRLKTNASNDQSILAGQIFGN